MKVKCADCGNEFELEKCYYDELGMFTTCPECHGNFDVPDDSESDLLSCFIETYRGKIEEIGYSVTEYVDEYYFAKSSSGGKDFGFCIEKGGTVREFIDRIYDYYNDFDVSEEAYLWLDNSGHGKNGAPYDMKDVYEDAAECKEFIIDLYNILIGTANRSGESRKTLWVCNHCLMAIESREGNQARIAHSVDETDPEDSRCSWCEENGFDTLYELV